MDNSISAIGVNEQNNISQLSDCILHYYKTNVNENAQRITNEILRIIDDDSEFNESMAKIDEYKDELLAIRIQLSKDCIIFNQFMKMNESNRNELTALSESLKEKIAQRKRSVNDKYELKAIQQRYEDLLLTCAVSEQIDQQLKIFISNNQITVSSIENTVFSTLTLWKNRIFLENQRKQYN